MMRTPTMLALLAVLAVQPVMAEKPGARGSTVLHVYEDTVHFVKDGKIGLDDEVLPLADNVVVLTRDGRPARLADLRRGSRVEVTMLRGGVIQQIRLLK